MSLLRQLDLVALALALPLFALADFPMLGYAVGGAAWLIQKAISHWVTQRAAASDDARTTVGLLAGSMIGRGWFVAIAIFVAGLSDNDAGLAAAVLVITLFTIYFTVNMILRPFDTHEAPQ